MQPTIYRKPENVECYKVYTYSKYLSRTKEGKSSKLAVSVKRRSNSRPWNGQYSIQEKECYTGKKERAHS